MADTHLSLRAIFNVASEIAPGAGRQAYLDQACRDDAALRANVEELLRVEESAGGFLADPKHETTIQIVPVTEREGALIGRYKLLEKVGEGGCGVVFVAEQTEPVRRRVALKVIKLGMDTKQVVARFEAERQALAMMDHPNIAKVLDAGATEQGRPYFVMELVRGIKITDYCDQAHLTTNERIGLFIKVCQAIQHAHQKGIIHRDIKPSNILVTLHDGVPVPKVIDFGIAKATEGRLTDATVYTQLHQFIGTPAYMSPEQAEMSGLDIDTRSDIYSLGVLLYELLAGSTPFDAKELISLGIDAMRKTIREKEPMRPSTRFATLQAQELTTTAKLRSTDTSKLVNQLKGDLDWIVMKCLEKDRTRRYDTANGLAMDLQRHFGNEPVVARPPSTMYRMQKFMRRNKLAFAAGTAIAAMLVLGLAASLWQAARADREARRAVAAERQATAKAAAERAAREESEAVSKFMTEVFQSPNPTRRGRNITVADTLDRAVTNVDHELAAHPGVQARLLVTLGDTYYALGLSRQAIPLMERARDYYVKNFGLEHTNTLPIMSELALCYDDVGRLDEALKMQEQVLAVRRKVSGPEHPGTLNSMNNLASSYEMAGRREEALKLREEVLALDRKVLGPENPETLNSMNNLATSYDMAGRREEALKLREEVLALRREVNGPEHPDTFRAMGNLSVSYDEAGRHHESLKLREEALTLARKVLGPEHPDTLSTMNNLAISYQMAGRQDEALKLCVEVLSLRRKVNGPEHPDTFRAMRNLANSYDASGRKDESMKLRDEVLTLARKVLGPEHPDTLSSMNELAASYAEFGRSDEALKLQEEELALSRKVLGPEHPSTIQSLNLIAWFLATSETAGIRNGTNAVQFAEEAVAATHRSNPVFLDTLSASYAEAQQFDRAAATQQEAIGLLKTEAEKQDYATRLKLYQAHQPYREPRKP
jgi:serine/threonine protein kinase